MTRCRCAECGAVLAISHMQYDNVDPLGNLEMEVHPCGACLQEARADAIADAKEQAGEMRLLEQEGRD